MRHGVPRSGGSAEPRGGTVDLAVVGGEVATSRGARRAGVAIADGRIVAVGPESELPDAREYLDVAGAVVLPGVVDIHLHYDRDGRLTDRVGPATRSGAFGGVTSAVAFLNWRPRQALGEVLDEAIAELEAESYLDLGYSIYLHANDFQALAEIPELVRRGIAGFKMAMAYKRRGMMCSDEFLLAALETIGRAGGMAHLHAESGELIEHLERVALREGRKRPIDYSATRPVYAEAEAVSRAAAFGRAAGCPIHIVHLTSRAALDAVLAAQASGCQITAETCPQYLVLTEAEMEHQGPLAKIAPPLRTAEDQAALWLALARDQISVVASDHAPHPASAKQIGWEDIFQSPFGAPQIETMLPLLYSEGAVRRGLGLAWLAWVSSEAPARLTGLYPRKGSLEPGADADLVVIDPQRSVTIEAGMLHSEADYTPYSGLTTLGWPTMTIVGGEVLVRDGELQRDPGRARFLGRRLPLAAGSGGRDREALAG